MVGFFSDFFEHLSIFYSTLYVWMPIDAPVLFLNKRAVSVCVCVYAVNSFTVLPSGVEVPEETNEGYLWCDSMALIYPIRVITCGAPRANYVLCGCGDVLA